MIQLTPIEETVAGKELIQMGREKASKKASKKGIEKGELIGKIQMAQRFLKRPVTPKPVLKEKNVEALQMILQKLESELFA